MSTPRQKHRVLSIGLARAGELRGAAGRILGGLQNSNLEKRERERERGMNNALQCRNIEFCRSDWPFVRPARRATGRGWEDFRRVTEL